MLTINRDLTINEDEILIKFVRSSGPGGQNVNKVSTAVQLRFNVVKSDSLPTDVRDRLAKLAGKRLTDDGVLIIEAHQHRTQDQNRQEAIERLVKLINEATQEPKVRLKSKITTKSKQRRLEEKRRRGQIKNRRRPIKNYDE